MALRKAVVNRSGVTLAYWRVLSLTENYAAGEASALLAGYLSAEARQAGADPAAGIKIDIPAGSYSPDMRRKELYDAIKVLPAWSDSVDC